MLPRLKTAANLRSVGRSDVRKVTPEDSIPATLLSENAVYFWLTVILTGAGAGAGAIVLTKLLQSVQQLFWPGADILAAASQASPWTHVYVLLGAGALTGAGQIALRRLTSGNGIDITQAISEFAGRLPALRTVGTAVLSVVLVGMGAALGREGAPKQVGAVIANELSDKARLSDEQRRLLVACGAGAGMAAAYGVPLGGALFALEVLRGVLALRLILPALLACIIAAGISWLVLPNAPTYVVPAYSSSLSVVCWALIAGPIAGLVSIGYVHLVAWADRIKPRGWRRFVSPTIALGILGSASIAFPQLLGNGKDIAQLAFSNQVAPTLLVILLLLRPLATILCLASGVPGGLFTPSLALGALLGGVLGLAWSTVWPGVPPGLFAIVGAGAVLAATTHGPISAIVLVMELTARDRSFILPLVLAVVTATVVARTLDPRSIYDARLSNREIEHLQKARRPAAT
jgi:chloride channel protein, CIC family